MILILRRKNNMKTLIELQEILGKEVELLSNRDNHLKQSDLAKMIGYSDKSISKWERGKCFPKDTEAR